ncbi:hypothetical protein KIN20_012711 [Parelaphostrongylus tenuis]|uniref:Uncharacterized protein n=1 Tax=Parelaphostrongylus tenuis TaxID=148309 RepID=A0AAD5MFK8_PARTN|nr:hypothetical protein KIN20_012711 [Parelaphostrongylus tenuis]
MSRRRIDVLAPPRRSSREVDCKFGVYLPLICWLDLGGGSDTNIIDPRTHTNSLENVRPGFEEDEVNETSANEAYCYLC